MSKRRFPSVISVARSATPPKATQEKRSGRSLGSASASTRNTHFAFPACVCPVCGFPIARPVVVKTFIEATPLHSQGGAIRPVYRHALAGQAGRAAGLPRANHGRLFAQYAQARHRQLK